MTLATYLYPIRSPLYVSMEKEMEQREMSINNIYKAEDSNPSLVHNVVRERACEGQVP